jgi:hypothetical protein
MRAYPYQCSGENAAARLRLVAVHGQLVGC